jgi:hypothetical protein
MPTRWSLLPIALLIALPARAGQVELEVGGGAAFASAVAPMLSVRAGYDLWDHLTLSARFLGIDQPTQSQYDGVGGNAPVEYQGWQAMAEVRGHTAGTIQWNLALAAGLGEATLQYPPSVQGGPTPGLEHGGVAPAGLATVGTRLRLPLRLWVAFDLGVNFFSGLDIPQPNGTVATGQLDGGFLTFLSIGWSPI